MSSACFMARLSMLSQSPGTECGCSAWGYLGRDPPWYNNDALNQRSFPERKPGVSLYPRDFKGIPFDGTAIQEVQVPPCSDVLQALRRDLQTASGAVARQPPVEEPKLPLPKDEPLTAAVLEEKPEVRPKPRLLKAPVQVVEKHFIGDLDADLVLAWKPGHQMPANPLCNPFIWPDSSFCLPGKEKNFTRAHAIKIRLQAFQVSQCDRVRCVPL